MQTGQPVLGTLPVTVVCSPSFDSTVRAAPHASRFLNLTHGKIEMRQPALFFLAALAAILLCSASNASAQFSHYYVDHLPTTLPDSCYWAGCECGGIYPSGPDYVHSVISGRNYDPNYPDSCETEYYHDCPPMQPEHIFRVPCAYDSATGDLLTGCFTLAFTITQCQGFYGPKTVDSVRITLRDQNKHCRNDTTNFLDTIPTPDDTVAQFIDNPLVPGSSTVTLNIQPNLTPPYPCIKRTLSFEVCDLWKRDHGPADQTCPTVFEFSFVNSDGTECGTIPFVMYGICIFPGPDPVIREGDQVYPLIENVQIIKYGSNLE